MKVNFELSINSLVCLIIFNEYYNKYGFQVNKLKMVFSTILRLFNSCMQNIHMSKEPCGIIPYSRRSRTKQLRDDIHCLINSSTQQLGLYFKLLDYMYILIRGKDLSNYTFDRQIAMIPIFKFQLLK